jgi:hypothetical protein
MDFQEIFGDNWMKIFQLEMNSFGDTIDSNDEADAFAKLL